MTIPIVVVFYFRSTGFYILRYCNSTLDWVNSISISFMENTEEKPPILGSWSNIYRLVIGFFIFQIILYYIFTRMYS
jgi:hypothetical protein